MISKKLSIQKLPVNLSTLKNSNRLQSQLGQEVPSKLKMLLKAELWNHLRLYVPPPILYFTTLIKGRIATRSKKPKNSQKSAAPHFGKNITTFAKADLPSDDEEDVEFNISSDKHEEEEEEEDEDEDEEEDFSEVDDIPVLQDEDTRTSIRLVFKPKDLIGWREFRFGISLKT